MFVSLSATPGQNLFLCTANGVWTQLPPPAAPGAGTPITSTTALTDLALTQTGGQVLTIGQNCSLATPCNVRFGTRTFPITGGVTVTLDPNVNNSGLVYVYAAVQGLQSFISVGSTMAGVNNIAPITVSCNGPTTNCSYVGVLNQFPADTIPLATWSATGGVFNLTGLTDLRAFLSNKSVIGGIGVITADVLGQTIVSADTTVVGVRVSVPVTAADACQEGNYAADTSFFYQCIAANTWRRVAVASW